MTKKGSHEERTVVKKFIEHGYAAIRVPASGAKTKDDKPDVLAGNSRYYYAVEVKSTKGNYIYIRSEQIKELLRFSAIFGATPIVCAKFTRIPYKIINPYHLEKTNSGKYKIHRKNMEEYPTLEEYLTNNI